ncbi:MAG: 30S ribosomal protein S6 [Candidatus Peregrinibacteria bacterium]
MEYEIMMILPPNLGEDRTKKELKEVQKLITSEGGEISKEDVWGVKDFSFKIKKEEKGFYVVLNFTLEPDKLKEIEHLLTLNQNILRFMVTKTPKNYEFKTLKQLEEESEALKKEEQAIAKEKAPMKDKPKVKEAPKKEKPKPEAPKKKEEPKPEEPKPEEPKPEEPKPEEPKPEKPKPEEPKPEEPKKEDPIKEMDLDEVDEKLRAIIDDPDISL